MSFSVSCTGRLLCPRSISKPNKAQDLKPTEWYHTPAECRMLYAEKSMLQTPVMKSYAIMDPLPPQPCSLPPICPRLNRWRLRYVGQPLFRIPGFFTVVDCPVPSGRPSILLTHFRGRIALSRNQIRIDLEVVVRASTHRRLHDSGWCWCCGRPVCLFPLPYLPRHKSPQKVVPKSPSGSKDEEDEKSRRDTRHEEEKIFYSPVGAEIWVVREVFLPVRVPRMDLEKDGETLENARFEVSFVML
jgi:hypothetical protein